MISSGDVVYSEKVVCVFEKWLKHTQDIFSFGVVLSEIFGRKPFQYPKSFKDLPTNVREYQKLVMIKKEEVEVILPSECPKEIKELIRKCIDRNPEKRPSFIQIVTELTQAVENGLNK